MSTDAGGKSALSDGLGLVERLRQGSSSLAHDVTMHEAADEIQRLYQAIARISVHIVRLGVPAFGYVEEGIDKLVVAERERCIAACVEVMNAYGGDPAGRLLSSERVRMQHQLQASGAAQCIGRIRGPNVQGEAPSTAHTTLGETR
jgi:hypothetical protein